MFAEVIIDIVNQDVDRPFSYRIPDALTGAVSIGSPVLVPFGKGNALRKGYVVSLKEESDLAPEKVKEIDSVVEKGLSVEEQLLSLASYMRHRYGGTLYQCLSVVMPSKSEMRSKKPRFLVFLPEKATLPDEIALALKKKHYAKARLLEAFTDHERIPTSIASDRLSVSSATIRSMEKAGLIGIVEEKGSGIMGEVPEAFSGGSGITLNGEQEEAVKTVLSGEKTTSLIFGVTGSGKTEIYIRLIEEVLKEGREAIVLIPEIALTYQTVMRFYDRFGELVSVVHSRLSQGEKAERFMKAKAGEIRVMIGPRSALFTPFRNLGLIVVDEFHESSYRSDQVPKYDAVDLAVKRGEIAGAKVVLGSASPLVEQYKKALSGEIELIRLTKRAVSGSSLPVVTLVDMREELKNRNRSVFSRALREKILDRQQKGEQIMLFLNRRGYSGAVSCRSCGEAVGCPHCSVSLNYHRNGILKCHICGYERPMVTECPKCGSKLVGTFGLGTEKVEELIQKEFPGLRVLRMDADTTSGKNGHQEILEKFLREEADVLVGTQMIVKGHDFPKVTLVGILAADLSLFIPDFRSAERTFELLLQAEGRAGRRDTPGECVVQTYNPEHYAVIAAKNQDYEAFYREEIKYRKMLLYPPEGAFLCARVSGRYDDRTSLAAERLKKAVESRLSPGLVRFLGPAEDTLKKVKDSYRYCFYMKGKELSDVLRAKQIEEEEFERIRGSEKVYLTFES